MKRVLFIFFIFIGVSCSFLYYSWRQATQLPEWYTNQSRTTQNTLDLNKSSEVLATQSRLQEKINEKISKALVAPLETQASVTDSTTSQSKPLNNTNSSAKDEEVSKNKNVEIELSNQEFNELLITKLAQHQEQSKILNATSGLQTAVKDGVLETGAVINLTNIPRDKLATSETKALDKVVKTFPMLENKDIYIGLSGKPKIENGQLRLDENTQVKMGNLSLSLSELSQRLGIPQEQLKQKLSLSLELGRLKVNDMTLINSKVLLRGAVE